MNRIAFRVTGRVQGVGFRRFVEIEAAANGLAGFVRNEADGSVTGEAEGGEAATAAFVDALGRGPLFARVDRVETRPVPSVGERGFEVRRDR